MSKKCVLVAVLLACVALVAVNQNSKRLRQVPSLQHATTHTRNNLRRFSDEATSAAAPTLPEGAAAHETKARSEKRSGLPFEEKWKPRRNMTRGSPASREWLGRCCRRYINTYSGCKIARWYYSVGEGLRNHGTATSWQDCDGMPARRNLTRAGALEEKDTVYVTLRALPYFVDWVLDEITVEFVLIAGQNDIVRPVDDDVIARILNNTLVIGFFCQNLQVYGGRDKRHEKLHPFPYGLNPLGGIDYLNFVSEMENSLNKTEFIYAGALSETNAGRKGIPQAEWLPRDAFLQKVGSARYLVSPDGDRPECYRHYEALLMGTVPVTQMDPFLYRHLSGGPVVFANEDWDLASLEKKLEPDPLVNRHLVLEEYWMDWVDHTVGIELNWSDELDSGEHGFADGPYGSWAPIGDGRNDWVSVSDVETCVRWTNMHPGPPRWGISGEGRGGAVTRHVACCTNATTLELGSNALDQGAQNAAPNVAEEGTDSRRHDPRWFDRTSGWEGRTYDEAVSFCADAGGALCPFEAYCPGGLKQLSTVGAR